MLVSTNKNEWLKVQRKKTKKMLGKFRGTLYGVLVGDCFGNLFQENSILSKGSRLVLRNFLDNLEKQPNAAGKQHLFC